MPILHLDRVQLLIQNNFIKNYCNCFPNDNHKQVSKHTDRFISMIVIFYQNVENKSRKEKEI